MNAELGEAAQGWAPRAGGGYMWIHGGATLTVQVSWLGGWHNTWICAPADGGAWVDGVTRNAGEAVAAAMAAAQ